MAKPVALAFAFLLLAGCSQAPPSLDASDGAPAARESRPGGGGSGDVASGPVEWEGRTPEEICVETPLGCAGSFTFYGFGPELRLDDSMRALRVTVTWDAVDAATRELEVRAGALGATGPSPLVLLVPNEAGREKVEVTVEGIRRGPVVVLPSQPYKAVAEAEA